MSTNSPLSLTELQHELAQWRVHRQPRHIPQSIRAQAVNLLQWHKPIEIKTALNINHRTLKRWKAECGESSVEPVKPKPLAFISVPSESSWTPSSSSLTVSTLTITRHSVDGSALSVQGTLSLEQWRDALSLFNVAEVSR